MELTPLEQDPETGRNFVNEHTLQVGHVLPLIEKSFKEYFPPEQSFLSFKAKRPTGIFSYRSGRDKNAPTLAFRVIVEPISNLSSIVKEIEKLALAQEKIIARTSLFGYDEKKLKTFNSLGYKVGASLPGIVSLDGRRFDYHFAYKDLSGRYGGPVKRSYAKQGMYPHLEVEKARDAKLKVRGYRKEDRAIIDGFSSHDMVIRGIASGIFSGMYPWSGSPTMYDQSVESGRTVPLVCEEQATSAPVGVLDLHRPLADVMQHSASLGMLVKAEYQGMGAGTMLMESMKTLAKRMHLARVWLSVFEGNTPAQRLYQKVGFEECGSVPGWLQEGYVNEIFMALRLD